MGKDPMTHHDSWHEHTCPGTRIYMARVWHAATHHMRLCLAPGTMPWMLAHGRVIHQLIPRATWWVCAVLRGRYGQPATCSQGYIKHNHACLHVFPS